MKINFIFPIVLGMLGKWMNFWEKIIEKREPTCHLMSNFIFFPQIFENHTLKYIPKYKWYIIKIKLTRWIVVYTYQINDLCEYNIYDEGKKIEKAKFEVKIFKNI